MIFGTVVVKYFKMKPFYKGKFVGNYKQSSH